MLVTMARTFEAGGLAEGLGILTAVVVLGGLFGLILSKVRLPGVLAHVLGLLLGILWCYLLLTTLIELPPLLQPDGWLAAQQAKGEILATRLQLWLGAAARGTSSSDSLPFVVQMSGICWLIAFYGAWSLFHNHWVWGAVLPPGLVIFLGVYYAPPGLITYFIYYLLWSLILVVRSNVYQREREWQSHRVIYEPWVGIEFLRDGALIALVVVGLVWVLPHPSPSLRWSDAAGMLEGPWQRVQDEWRRLYASLTYRDQLGSGSFGRTLTLSGAMNLGQTPVLEVKATEERYWRAVLLDRYTGSGWVDTSPVKLRFEPGDALTQADAYLARAVLTQTVTYLRKGELLLLAAAEPLRVPLRTDAQGLLKTNGVPEISCVLPAQSLGREQRYTVESLVSTASIRSLRQAGTNYPAWVIERYLQLPATLPRHIAELAREVAGAQGTPYDKAAAIEAYLRQLRYNQAIDAPPAGSDPVEWFLFERREGYCTYFASAMVLMCRAVGVPARLAQGYAPGQYAEERGAYVIRESDAHAWPEVYFPSYGWIEFEPTPSRPTFLRPTGDELANPNSSPANPADAPRRRPTGAPEDELEPGEVPQGPAYHVPLIERLPWRQIGLGALLLALAGGTAWYYGRRWWTLRPAERLYMRLTWIARPLGVRADPCLTPRELAAALDEALRAGRPLARPIVDLYVRDRFAGRRASPRELAAGGRAWRRAALLSLQRFVGRLFAGRPRTQGGEMPQ